MNKKTLTLSLIASFMIVAANRAFAKNQFPKPHTLVGLAFAYLVLGFLAEIGRGAEEFAAYMGVLILVGITLTQGVPVFNGISKELGGKKK